MVAHLVRGHWVYVILKVLMPPVEPQSNNVTPTPPPPGTPPGTPAPQAPKLDKRAWSAISRRAAAQGKVVGLLVAILIGGGAGGYAIDHYYLHPAKPATTAKSPVVTTLSPEDIAKLSQIGTSLGNSSQVLTIGANSVFQGNVQIASDLTLNGKLNANGAVSFPTLTISGQSTFATVTVAQNLQVGGATTLQNGLNVTNFANINGTLNVNGATSLGSTTISALTVRNISIAGPLTIGHVLSTGPNPTAVAGNVGGGGTISISGNDTTGTININTGSGPGSGVLISVTFKAAFGSPVHVLLTALDASGAGLPAYVSPSTNGFSINADSGVAAGTTYSYSYFVVD
jgi:hypothetical protein